MTESKPFPSYLISVKERERFRTLWEGTQTTTLSIDHVLNDGVETFPTAKPAIVVANVLEGTQTTTLSIDNVLNDGVETFPTTRLAIVVVNVPVDTMFAMGSSDI
ncbi:2123_t:CDS:2 [Gigaspora rosea]|nr:2123_t:CDS:2 [Gigaspora rosea]